MLAGSDARAHYFIADDGRAERFSYSFAVSHNQSGADGDARAVTILRMYLHHHRR